jgi:hypothetical protein
MRTSGNNRNNGSPPAKRQKEEEQLYAVHVAQIEIIGYNPTNNIWFENYKNRIDELFSKYLYSFSIKNSIGNNKTINNDTKQKITKFIQNRDINNLPKYDKILGGENGLYFNIFKMTKDNFEKNIEYMINFSNYGDSYNSNYGDSYNNYYKFLQAIMIPKQNMKSLFYPVVFIFELDKLLNYIITVGTENKINPSQLFYWNPEWEHGKINDKTIRFQNNVDIFLSDVSKKISDVSTKINQSNYLNELVVKIPIEITKLNESSNESSNNEYVWESLSGTVYRLYGFDYISNRQNGGTKKKYKRKTCKHSKKDKQKSKILQSKK